MNLIKDTLKDGKDDEYKLVYTEQQKGLLSLPSVLLMKNNILIDQKTGNCVHSDLTNMLWRDMVYNNLSGTQKDNVKADFENVKKQLINCNKEEKNEYSESYPNIFADSINYCAIKRYDGSYDKSIGLSLHPGYLNEDIGLFKSGGYMIAPIDTPISTVGMYECAALYIPDKASEKHFLWHVDKNTSVEKIAENIKKNNLPADKIWIAEGCNSQTQKTISNIIEAVKSINKNVRVAVVSPSKEEQEVIGYKGELFGSYKTVNVSFDTPKTEFCS